MTRTYARVSPFWRSFRSWRKEALVISAQVSQLQHRFAPRPSRAFFDSFREKSLSLRGDLSALCFAKKKYAGDTAGEAWRDQASRQLAETKRRAQEASGGENARVGFSRDAS